MTFWTRLKYYFPGEVKFQEPLKNYTSFGIGGLADALATVNNSEQLSKLIALANDYQQPVLVLGRGTNLLVRDQGIRGVVIRLSGKFRLAEVQGTQVVSGAAGPISSLLRLSIQCQLSGLEFAAGLPASLGGAVYMNAGSVEEQIGSLVREIHLVYPDGSSGVRPFKKLKFFYRGCSLAPGEIITRVILQLRKIEDKETIRARIRQNYAYRLKHQPLREKSAGCIFKNPKEESAGKLIDQAGLKGLSVGGAQVSTTHANFIVNRHEASCNDVLHLIDKIQRKVYQSFGITLEPEVMIVGEEG